MNATTDHRIHHETVKELLERYPIWRHPEFQRLIKYPAPDNHQLLRLEMVKLQRQGWTDKRIAQLLRCSRNTVIKWLRRARLAELQPRNERLQLTAMRKATQSSLLSASTLKAQKRALMAQAAEISFRRKI